MWQRYGGQDARALRSITNGRGQRDKVSAIMRDPAGAPDARVALLREVERNRRNHFGVVRHRQPAHPRAAVLVQEAERGLVIPLEKGEVGDAADTLGAVQVCRLLEVDEVRGEEAQLREFGRRGAQAGNCLRRGVVGLELLVGLHEDIVLLEVIVEVALAGLADRDDDQLAFVDEERDAAPPRVNAQNRWHGPRHAAALELLVLKHEDGNCRKLVSGRAVLDH